MLEPQAQRYNKNSNGGCHDDSRRFYFAIGLATQIQRLLR
jgi:hypothetical protein